MADSTSCALTSQTVSTITAVCQSVLTSVRMTTPSLRCGTICAPISVSAGAAHGATAAASSPRSRALRPTAASMRQSNPNTHGDSNGNAYSDSDADTNPDSDALHVTCGSEHTKRN